MGLTGLYAGATGLWYRGAGKINQGMLHLADSVISNCGVNEAAWSTKTPKHKIAGVFLDCFSEVEIEGVTVSKTNGVGIVLDYPISMAATTEISHQLQHKIKNSRVVENDMLGLRIDFSSISVDFISTSITDAQNNPVQIRSSTGN